jgi:hypothetical protein
MWAKIAAWFHNSVTVFLARVMSIAGVVITALDTLSGVLSMPQFADPLTDLMGARFKYALIVIGVLVEIARRWRALLAVKGN